MINRKWPEVWSCSLWPVNCKVEKQGSSHVEYCLHATIGVVLVMRSNTRVDTGLLLVEAINFPVLRVKRIVIANVLADFRAKVVTELLELMFGIDRLRGGCTELMSVVN